MIDYQACWESLEKIIHLFFGLSRPSAQRTNLVEEKMSRQKALNLTDIFLFLARRNVGHIHTHKR